MNARAIQHLHRRGEREQKDVVTPFVRKRVLMECVGSVVPEFSRKIVECIRLFVGHDFTWQNNNYSVEDVMVWNLSEWYSRAVHNIPFPKLVYEYVGWEGRYLPANIQPRRHPKRNHARATAFPVGVAFPPGIDEKLDRMLVQLQAVRRRRSVHERW